MSAPRTPLPLKAWPPLITSARLPRWLAIRDVVLTVLAWCFLGGLLRDSIYLTYDYLRHPIFELTTTQSPDFVMIWRQLHYFVMISIALMVALCLWALIDRGRLLGATRTSQPTPLTIAEQAARAGINERIVGEARKFKVTNVRFNDDGSIAGLEEVIRTGVASPSIEPASPEPAA